MEYYNNILCISAPELTGGDPESKDPKEWPIISYYAFECYVKRNPHVRVRRACKNTPALLQYDKLRSDIKDRIVAKYGDPRETTPRNHFENSIKGDPKALEFYQTYRIGAGRSLPEESQKEYYNNAIVLNAIHFTLNDTRAFRKARQGNVKNMWSQMSALVNKLNTKIYPHTLPSDHRRLADKYRIYLKGGYETLIHSAFCNSNAEKINDLGKMWLLARWANQVDKIPSEPLLLEEYNEKAKAEGWNVLKTVGPIHAYLHRSDIKPLWYGYRHGELKSKEKFAMQLSTILPSMRDSLWYSDGTKLNYYYLSKEGKIETCNVYVVMDAYSEVFLGYHISSSEDYQAQYGAYKMAFKMAGHKPYQVSFDNQGGHRKLQAGEFFSKLARIAINTQPYNGKSKTIENAFSRFQQQYLKRDWFFTGQNITAKADESRGNLEFVMANKDNLPSLEEIKAKYLQRHNEWNHDPHPSTGRSRIEMYYGSVNEKAPAVSQWDMVDMFWLLRKDPVTCRAYGISFQEKKAQYDYLVYSAPMVPDQQWLRNNIDKKFWIKFDPDDMGLIYLYEKDALGLRFVTEATTKITIHRGKQEQEDFEAALIRQVTDENKRIRIESKEKMEEILREQGQDAESYGLNVPPVKGIESTRKKKRRSSRKIVLPVEDPDKEISNIVPIDTNGEEIVDYYSLY